MATWTGASDNNFVAMFGNNWEPFFPSAGDSLAFGTTGVGGLLLNNNGFSNAAYSGITFNPGAGPFVIGDGTNALNAGNSFVLVGDIVNNSSNLQTINSPFSITITAMGGRVFTTTAGGGDLALGGNISGSYSLIKDGVGTLTLSGTSTYGGTYISEGTVVLNGNTAGSGRVNMGFAPGGSGNIEVDFGSGISGSNLVLRGGVTVLQVNPIDVSDIGSTGKATLGFTGSTSRIYTDVSLGRGIVVTSNSSTRGNRSFMGRLTGPGAGAGNDSLVVDPGTGNWMTIYPKDTGAQSVANTFSGNVRIKSGTVEIAGLTYISDISSNENLTIPSTASVTVDSGATLQLAWGGQTFDALNGGGTIQRDTTDGQGTRTLRIGANGGSGSFNGSINSLLNLMKTGAGTQILSGTNAFVGATSVTGGTLEAGISGKITASSAFSVSGGGTLRISNPTNNPLATAPLTLDTGTLKFGNALGGISQAFTTLTLDHTATIDFGTGTTGNTFEFAAFTLAPTFTALTVLNWTGGNADHLVFDTGTFSGADLAKISFYGDAGQFLGTGGQVAFNAVTQLIPVPEPSAAALLALGTLALGSFSRRRRRW